MLAVVGHLIDEGNEKVQGETVVYDNLQHPIAQKAWTVCGIYAGFVLFCGFRFVCARMTRKGQVEEEDEE